MILTKIASHFCLTVQNKKCALNGLLMFRFVTLLTIKSGKHLNLIDQMGVQKWQIE